MKTQKLMTRAQAWDFISEQFARKKPNRYTTDGLCLAVNKLFLESHISEVTGANMSAQTGTYRRKHDCGYFIWETNAAGRRNRSWLAKQFSKGRIPRTFPGERFGLA